MVICLNFMVEIDGDDAMDWSTHQTEQKSSVDVEIDGFGLLGKEQAQDVDMDMRAEADSDEEEEDLGDVTDNEADGRRPVAECVSAVFFDDENEERFCRLCK